MSHKLNAVVQDILILLQKTEPDMLLWREIKARLWPRYKEKYKDGKVFSVALSNYLTKYKGKKWKHEGDYYGTFESSTPKFARRKSRWIRLKENFKQVGDYLTKITVKKASDDGVDPITGWDKFRYDTEYSAEVIIVLRNAPELVKRAKKFDISFRRDYEKKVFAGVVLTPSKSISSMDQFTWQNELYKIWDTEDVMDGYDFSYRIGYLEWFPK